MYRGWLLLTLTLTCVAQAPPQPPTVGPQAKPEHKISEIEAKELFASVDELMRFASQDSGLPLKTRVKRQLVSRDAMEKLLTKRMSEDKDAQRFERSELVLKKFGMLPADFSLRAMLMKVLREQVAGYYDVKEKTINLLDWLPAETQRPVLAHELTHALQDQTIDLEQWADQPDSDDKDDRFNKNIRSEEESFARSAVTEGQAMIVLLDYLLRDTGRSVAKSPELVYGIRANPIQKDSEMAKAPLIVRESMMFPYREGAEFVATVLSSGGKPLAFADLLRKPPVNSHQILDPPSYIAGEEQLEIAMPDLSPALGERYAKFDSGAVGEFDTQVFLRQFNRENALQIADAWRGGMYYAGQRESSAQSTDEIALLYVSFWKDAESARAFRDAYVTILTQRYPGIKKEGAGWESSGGPIQVVQQENAVIACEGFDTKTADALIALVIHPEAERKVALDHGELSFALGAHANALLRAAGIH